MPDTSAICSRWNERRRDRRYILYCIVVVADVKVVKIFVLTVLITLMRCV
jgi:hypothetical protein